VAARKGLRISSLCCVREKAAMSFRSSAVISRRRKIWGRALVTLPISGAKSIGLVGRLTRLGGFWHRVGLALPLDRVRIEGVGVTGSEGRSGGYQDVVEAAREIATRAQFNAGGVDTFFLREVLCDVEVSLGRGVR